MKKNHHIVRWIVLAVVVLVLAWLIILSPWHESLQAFFVAFWGMIKNAWTDMFGGG